MNFSSSATQDQSVDHKSQQGRLSILMNGDTSAAASARFGREELNRFEHPSQAAETDSLLVGCAHYLISHHQELRDVLWSLQLQGVRVDVRQQGREHRRADVLQQTYTRERLLHA